MTARVILVAAIALIAGCSSERPAENVAGAPPVEANTAGGPAEQKMAASPGRQRSSSYSALSAADCAVLEEHRDDVGYWLRRCPGAGGYRLDWSESDLRQGLAVVAGASSEQLDIARLVSGGAFASLGGTVEWRGDSGARPDRLVVRVNVADHAHPQGPDISKLVVARLRSPACIVAVVGPGPAQSADARAIADGERAECLTPGG